MRYLTFTTIPFEHEENFPSAEEMVKNNYFGNNIGNLFFTNAIVRSLLFEGNEIVNCKSGIDISSFDAGILMYANHIRNGSKSWFDSDYDMIKNNNIPFVIVCVGSDSDPQFHISLEPEVRESIKKCYSLILSRTESIGVRGDMTKQVLVEQVGIPENRIDVIGCPSVRYFGKNFIKKPLKDYCKIFNDDFKIAVNFTGYHYDNDEAIYLYNLLKKYKRSYVIFTDKVEAELLWYKQDVPQFRRHDLLPTTTNHFIIQQNRARFLAKQEDIMNMMRTFDFSIGSRIHQAIIAILSGCPAILIAHSLRVLEIAQHHRIPYIMRTELIERQPSVEELYYRACIGMNEFYDSYDEKLKEYTDFLQKNNLSVNPDFLL